MKKMKRLLALLLAMMSLCTCASAERIVRTLEPERSDAPWCENIAFDMDMEEPENFPCPIPCYQTKYADVDVDKLLELLAERGMPKPEKESWYKGRDDISRRNFVFKEKNHLRYQLYAYPWGLPVWTADTQKQEQANAAVEICRAFLENAGIMQIEWPYFTVKRAADKPVYERNAETDEENNIFTGIGFRYTLGGLTVAVPGLCDPEHPEGREEYYDSWGSMTVRDDGVITAFELTNYREVEQELAPYGGAVIPWEQAVDTVLNEMIHWTYTVFGESGPKHIVESYRRVSVKRVEPALALTPGGRSFPVWAVGLEIEEEHEEWGSYRYSMTQHVNAITGEFADAGEELP